MTDNFFRNIVVSLCFLIVLLFHKQTLPCPPSQHFPSYLFPKHVPWGKRRKWHFRDWNLLIFWGSIPIKPVCFNRAEWLEFVKIFTLGRGWPCKTESSVLLFSGRDEFETILLQLGENRSMMEKVRAFYLLRFDLSWWFFLCFFFLHQRSS